MLGMLDQVWICLKFLSNIAQHVMIIHGQVINGIFGDYTRACSLNTLFHDRSSTSRPELLKQQCCTRFNWAYSEFSLRKGGGEAKVKKNKNYFKMGKMRAVNNGLNRMRVFYNIN